MAFPSPLGLYRPSYEHDACGLGFVADLNREPTREVVDKSLEVVRRLAHRGAAGSDPETGDGCGLLLQIPHAFYQRDMARRGKTLPGPGDYGVATIFLPRDDTRRAALRKVLESSVRRFGQEIIGWRQVPVDPRVIGPLGRQTQPVIRQLFIGRNCPAHAFERVLFMIRKRTGKLANREGMDDFYAASCSARTVVYKGLVLPERMEQFFPDLREPDVRSTLALVHSRFSTNTFPSWERAHPYRRLAHNGEINTLRGNVNWMRAREPNLAKPSFGKHIEDFKQLVRPGGSDSSSLDNVVDFLLTGGRSLPHVLMMLVPEAWSTQSEMSPELRAFYEYHGALVEPWDGPAALVFTDGQLVGGCLDRNGLRPAKYVVTKTGLVVLASELGVLDFEASDIIEMGRLQPGKMLLCDTVNGQILRDQEVKEQVAREQPYGQWLKSHKIDLTELPRVPRVYSLDLEARGRLQRAFGYSREELRQVLAPMARNGQEPLGSMGNDAPLAVLSRRPQALFRYFKQQFAQVTNPAIDPIREELVMSLSTYLGGEGNLLDETPRQCHLVHLSHPILTNEDLAKLEGNPTDDFECLTLQTLFSTVGDPGKSLTHALERLCEQAEQALDVGYNCLILSDRDVDHQHAPIPSLLAVSAVHQHLIRCGRRMLGGLIVQSAEPKQVHDIALLVGFGATAVHPYLALETVHELVQKGEVGDIDVTTADANYVKALNKGLLKILSKMGISTILSYHGAQIFEAVGLCHDVIEHYFTGTPSPIGGIGLGEIAAEALARHHLGFGSDVPSDDQLEIRGLYAWRAAGEKHLWTPETIAKLQRGVRLEDENAYREYARLINDQSEHPVTLRGLWGFATPGLAVPIDEVEPAAEIVRRFCTGAMSFGSISQEAHETLAIAMNRIGGKSNSGEGGEDPARFVADDNGDLRRSAIKQVASARFGVSTHYLVNADELQIKIAQGAKPGEGGQLPGHKVDAVIARVRNSTPGVTLISPPPHHDIYSIEDLAQLIFDLKNVNPHARIGVKLVSESGIGTVAAGVAKAHADNIHIAGHDGGTGASPLSSIYHAGTAWEIGLAETQQVLVQNGLRSRVRLQVDGQLKTGRDVAFAALLGADEFGFATSALVAAGCVMMRKCHLNTCPVGVATQDPELRKRFKGTPEHVVRYFFFVAEGLRRIMARLGFRKVDDMVGRVDCILPRRDIKHAKAQHLDFSELLMVPPQVSREELYCNTKQDHGLSGVLDHTLIESAKAALEDRVPCQVRLDIGNHNRAFGAMFAGEIARRFGAEGLPEDTVRIDVTGTAGQSFGAFAVRGMTVALEGAANDYVGKGLSGGILSIRPPAGAGFAAPNNFIVGNTVLYGATGGRAFFAGQAGERFAVRNSGSVAVVEGVGDHGCEYMTGGVVVVLGPTGRNFAAGMSGGIAYVLDETGEFASRCNRAMVDLEEPGSDYIAFVRALVEEHVRRTESTKGTEILASWGEAACSFVKVMPVEYRRVLQASDTSPLKVCRHG